MMLHPALPICSQVIETQTIDLWLINFHQTSFQLFPLIRGNPALENRVLHPLTIILASFSNLRQTSLPFALNGLNVITHQNHHRITSFP